MTRDRVKSEIILADRDLESDAEHCSADFRATRVGNGFKFRSRFTGDGFVCPDCDIHERDTV
jgi:hypothetical protein